MRTFRFASLLLAAALWAGAPAHAQDVELAGVKYPPTLTLANTTLRLNGAGVRYKAVFKVYTAGLYLTAKAITTEQVLAASGPRRLHIVMLRKINASELGRLCTRGMEDNARPGEMSKLIPGILKSALLGEAPKPAPSPYH